MLLTTAQALVKFLDNQYLEVDGKVNKFVKGVFALFGHGNVLGLGQALEQDNGALAVIPGKNEQGMAHAAIAYAKQKKRREIFACTSSVGPGAANMLAASGTATANHIPVLFLPGDTHASRQPDPVLQQVEHPGNLSVSTNDTFKAVTRYWDRINRPEQLMSALLAAMNTLTSWDTGAVALCLPQDVEAEAYDYPDSFFKKRIHRLERFQPTQAMLEEAVALIRASKKPLIICGGGLRYSDGGEVLQTFCQKFNIPFGETQAGKGSVPYDFPFNLGGIGVTGGLAANRLAREADLIIGIGTRYTDFTSGSKELFNENVRFLNINTSGFHAGKLEGAKMVADAKTSLEQLLIALEGYRSAYTDEIEKAKDDWNQEIKRLFTIQYAENFQPEVPGHLDEELEAYAQALQTNLTQTRALALIQESVDESAVAVGSSGSLPGCMQRIWLPKQPDTYNMEYGYSCMGYEICGAVGVKLAEPQREVYAMVGDGSFLMLHSELITALQMGIKINILLFDNAGFGCINNLQMSNGMGSYGTEFRQNNDPKGSILTIDYAKVAAGYGAKTYSVHNEAELKLALADAKRQNRCTLLDIKVLPKTMTNGYEAWWNVGVAAVSEKEAVRTAYENKMEVFNRVRKY